MAKTSSSPDYGVSVGTAIANRFPLSAFSASGRCAARVRRRQCPAMKLTGEITVEAPREAVFARLRDARFFASCIDGVQNLSEIDPTHYKAVFETKIAYMKFRFDVTVELVRAEPPAEIEAKVEGVPLGIVGRLTARALTRLSQDGEATKVAYETESTLAGKLGSIGQPVLRAKAKEMEREFAKRLQAAFAPGATEGA